MRNKKLGFIINNLSGGGAEKTVLNLAQALADQGHEIHIILLKNSIDYPTTKDYSIHSLTNNGKAIPINLFRLNDYALAKKLRRCIHQITQDRDFDLILSNLHGANRVTNLAKINSVYYCIRNNFSQEKGIEGRIHTKESYRTKRIIKRYRKVYNQQHIVCISQGVCDDFLQYFSPKSIRTIYNPQDHDKINKLAIANITNIPSDDYIVHVGRFAKQKRHDWLFKAIQQLPTSHKLVLLIKPTPALLEMVAKLKLSKRVIIPGFQTNPFPWIKQAKLLVLSSEYEGFGNVIVEALMCGTPVVSTNCPSGPSEILTGELSRWLVPVGDPKALSEKILEALQTDIKIDPKLLEKFSIDTISKQYLALCDKHIVI